MPYKDKQKQKEYKKIWWNKNKDRYRYRWVTRLGSNQDKKILQFIKDKREGRQVPKHKALPIELFKYNNQAQQSFPDECIKQEDQFNLNYAGEINGYDWIEGVGYVTEDPKIFFKKRI